MKRGVLRNTHIALLACILLAFTSATSLAGNCGDVDNSGGTDIDDIVYLIAYVFQGGPDPDCESDCPPTVTDYDGNVYQTVLIGDQCWMMENLKVTHYRNGNPIPYVIDGGQWSGLSTGAYCEYGNNPANVETYGRLYNWFAVDDSRGLAPEGWHVPNDEEWKQLEMYLGMSQAEADGSSWRGTDEGGKLKEDGTTHWNHPNTGATNESSFTALPGGYRTTGSFFYMGSTTSFWSSTESGTQIAWFRKLDYEYSQVARSADQKIFGLSVRCVRD